MTTEIILPKLGFAMSEAILSEWLIADGTQVKEGEPLYVLESDKSQQEIEAPASGMLKIVADAGETYPVGHVLGHIG